MSDVRLRAPERQAARGARASDSARPATGNPEGARERRVGSGGRRTPATSSAAAGCGTTAPPAFAIAASAPDPLLGGDRESVSCFYENDGYIVYLRLVGDPGRISTQDVGEFGARSAGPGEHSEYHTSAQVQQ